MAGKKTYRVADEYVLLTTGTAQGPRTLGFYKGAVVPDDVSDESIAHHLSTGQIVPADEEPKPEPKAPAKAEK